MNTDTRMLKARVNDLFSMCEKRRSAVFSSFLDGGEAAVVREDMYAPNGLSAVLYGGYDEAERQILGVFPEWEDADTALFPISVIRFTVPKFRALTHRDYLGTLMSLGIDRGKTGDILTDDDGAYVILDSAIAEYVLRNMTKIANAGVKGEIIRIENFNPPPPKTRTKECVAASLRLDAVIAAALGISRANAERLVRDGLVKLNHREAINRSAQLSEGDLVSVRGSGRFKLARSGAVTGKGRLHIMVEKYI